MLGTELASARSSAEQSPRSSLALEVCRPGLFKYYWPLRSPFLCGLSQACTFMRLAWQRQVCMALSAELMPRALCAPQTVRRAPLEVFYSSSSRSLDNILWLIGTDN